MLAAAAKQALCVCVDEQLNGLMSMTPMTWMFSQ